MIEGHGVDWKDISDAEANRILAERQQAMLNNGTANGLTGNTTVGGP